MTRDEGESDQRVRVGEVTVLRAEVERLRAALLSAVARGT